MLLIAKILTALVALEHIGFLILEMFFWTKPIGLRLFKQTPEVAEATAALAANQGLYNGFLAAGLFWGLLYPDPRVASRIITFFLICVVIAGAYGGYSVSPTIALVQALPAVVALVLLWLARRAKG